MKLIAAIMGKQPPACSNLISIGYLTFCLNFGFFFGGGERKKKDLLGGVTMVSVWWKERRKYIIAGCCLSFSTAPCLRFIEERRGEISIGKLRAEPVT